VRGEGEKQVIAFFTALWLGILTSISPCPLATNIAAISYLSKHITKPRLVLWAGIAYTFGRAFVYAVLGTLIIASLVSVPVVANFLQHYINKALGPILILVGLFLFDIIKFNVPGLSLLQKSQKRFAKIGLKDSFFLGIIFALSFCPISAALFFGSLIPLSLKFSYGIALPVVYGLGTAIPVVIFAIGISIGVRSLSFWFNKVKSIEFYTRRITGAIFIMAGLYYVWAYIISTVLQGLR